MPHIFEQHLLTAAVIELCRPTVDIVETWNVRENRQTFIRDLARVSQARRGALLRRSASIAGGSATLLSRK